MSPNIQSWKLEVNMRITKNIVKDGRTEGETGLGCLSMKKLYIIYFLYIDFKNVIKWEI